MSNKFTGNKDVDYKIMMGLNDRDLLNFCQTDQYTSELCKKDQFWKLRFIAKFGNISLPMNITWRNFYLYRISSGSYTNASDGITVDVTIMKDSPLFQRVFKITKNFVMAEKSHKYDMSDSVTFNDNLSEVLIEAIGKLVVDKGVNGMLYEVDNTHGMVWNRDIENKLQRLNSGY